MSKDLVERKLHKAKISLMRDKRFVFWSGYMMVGKTQLVDDIPTARTNGRDEIYGRAFVERLSEQELRFVILHENMHKMYRHMTVWKKLWDEDPRTANIACDHVINLQIVDMDPTEQFIAMPRHENGKRLVCYDTRFRGMDTKRVYDILRKEKQEGGGGGEDGELDEHDWEGAQELSEEAKRGLEKELEHAGRQGKAAHERMNGKGAGGMDRLFDELFSPKVDWRAELREFVQSTCASKDVSSWRKVNRRFLSGGVYMPSLIGESIGKIVLGVDTSGSIGGLMLATFMSEAKAIFEEVRPESVELLYWDHVVARHETYGQGELDTILQSTKPSGGGGTTPSCVSRYLNEKNIKPECIVMLTDGEVGNDWGSEWPAPVLWVVVNKGSMSATTGKTINVKEL